MNPHDVSPIDFFNEWFAEPIVVTDNSVSGVIDALNRHPLANDQTAANYVMNKSRCRERTGRFRIYGENQDIYFCFVRGGAEAEIDPPVYFESCLDLKLDYGFKEEDIIGNDHVLVANHFTEFLWQILGHHICLRMESDSQFRDGVSGIVVDEAIEVDESFFRPLRREFPAGYSCCFADDIICIPDWGAAFLTTDSRNSFIARYSPVISRQWT